MKTVIKAKAAAGDLPPSQNMPWEFLWGNGREGLKKILVNN